MKTKLFLFALLAMAALSVSAQSDYSNYLNKALEKIEAGDCESAKKMYNVYKELSGKSVSSVEILLTDCTGKNGPKTYKLNDKIKIGEFIYRVAYIEEDGIHGFAIYDFGAGPLTEQMIKERKVPTRSEMALIAANASKLNLDRNLWYWTLDRYDSTWNYYYRLSDKSTGRTSCSSSYSILLIHRF